MDFSCLDSATLWQPHDTHFIGGFDNKWYQGKGAYGGVQCAGALRAFSLFEEDKTRLPRSLSFHFCAPALAGTAFFVAKEDRRGNYVSHLSGQIIQDTKCVASMVASFARPRRSRMSFDQSVAPQVVPPAQGRLMPDVPGIPPFAKNFEYRFAIGSRPFQGGEPHVGGWIRPRVPTKASPWLWAALIDAWPPALAAASKGFIAASSIEVSMHFLEPAHQDYDDDAYYLFEAKSEVARDGYGDEIASLYGDDGKLLVRARQSVAIFG